MTAPATVIVRARDEESSIENALRSLRRQTVRPEIILVDSGSTDRTQVIAAPLVDRVIEIAPEDFTFGHALNVGAAQASAPVHFALSAHCVARRADWIELSLQHYRAEDIAATNGIQHVDGRPVERPFVQRRVPPGSDPPWGFSNHASSWRATAWEQHPFDESIDYAEDREWAWRVLEAGWGIVFDPALWVDSSHAWSSPSEFFRRRYRSRAALAPYPQSPPYGLRRLARDWWWDIPVDHHSPTAHRFLNVKRLAGLAGEYLGHRSGRRSPRRSEPGSR